MLTILVRDWQLGDERVELAVGHVAEVDLYAEGSVAVSGAQTPALACDDRARCVFAGRVVAVEHGQTVVEAGGIRFFVDGAHEGDMLVGGGRLTYDTYVWEGSVSLRQPLEVVGIRAVRVKHTWSPAARAQVPTWRSAPEPVRVARDGTGHQYFFVDVRPWSTGG